MPVSPRSTVFCVVQDASSWRLLSDAARRAGALAIRSRREEYLAKARTVQGPQALVYDLHPWNEHALTFLSHVRTERPHIPILLYTPAKPAVGPLMMKVADMRVTNLLLHCADERESERVGRAVRDVVAAIPANLLLPVIHDVLGAVPNRVVRYVEQAMLCAMSPAGLAHLRPNELASACGTGLRTLERDLRKADLPAPQELLDWIRLLVVCFVSYWNGMAPGTVARGIGLTPNALYRLRHRRLSSPDLNQVTAGEEFKAVLKHLARRCRMPAGEADKIIDSLVA